MTPQKRLFDLGLATLLAVLLAPVMAVIAIVLWVTHGRPILYRSRRMVTPDRAFMLMKFRTMALVDDDGGVTGGHKANRITPAGRVLRHYRLDELPQFWNILRGDLSFVGPRPPLPEYVRRFPHLYRRVLQSRPGVTGLATLIIHRMEGRHLARCTDPGAADALYARLFIPRKARLDLIYQRHASLWFDCALIWRTATTVLRR